MSRIGKKPIAIPKGVTVDISKDNLVTVKGPKGTLTQQVDLDMKIGIENGELLVESPTNQKRHKALHGLYRALIANMVEGVTNGYEHKLELVGVGYKATNTGQILELSLGYSHSIYMSIPNEVKIATETLKGKAPTIILQGIDKQLIGQVAAKIKSLRPPEPYKGKGVKFDNEAIRRKAGKAAGGKK
ncbi:MAG: 50S ribosomal protein L6 [Thermoflexibacter sp.]|nr:50S ribosomal protein L6 [Thermoflexibacter sp.]